LAVRGITTATKSYDSSWLSLSRMDLCPGESEGVFGMLRRRHQVPVFGSEPEARLGQFLP